MLFASREDAVDTLLRFPVVCVLKFAFRRGYFRDFCYGAQDADRGSRHDVLHVCFACRKYVATKGVSRIVVLLPTIQNVPVGLEHLPRTR